MYVDKERRASLSYCIGDEGIVFKTAFHALVIDHRIRVVKCLMMHTAMIHDTRTKFSSTVQKPPCITQVLMAKIRSRQTVN